MTGSGGDAPPDNPWRWHAEADPYRDSAFGVLGVEPTTVLRRGHASSRRQQVRYGSVRYLGRAVDEAAINAAEQRLRDPAGRVLETLRVHEVAPAVVETADLAADLAQLPEPDAGGERDTALALDRETLVALVPPVQPRSIPPLPPLEPVGVEAFR
jgi:hypothetical protein